MINGRRCSTLQAVVVVITSWVIRGVIMPMRVLNSVGTMVHNCTTKVFLTLSYIGNKSRQDAYILITNTFLIIILSFQRKVKIKIIMCIERKSIYYSTETYSFAYGKNCVKRPVYVWEVFWVVYFWQQKGMSRICVWSICYERFVYRMKKMSIYLL